MEDSTKAEIIKGTTEIVKTAYEDAFQPVAKETGKALGTLGKTVNVALSPLRGMVWGYEQIEEFIHDKVSKKLEEKGTKEENIITPDPDIAVPTLEALRYSKLKDEFATLLSNAMDSNTATNVHPSFVDLLKQMSALDAKIIRAISVTSYTTAIKISRWSDETKQGKKPLAILFGSKLTDFQIKNYHEFSVSIDNLKRLGVLDVSFIEYLTEDKVYEPLKNHQITNAFRKKIDPQLIHETNGYLRLTDYGRTFKLVCT